MKKRFEGDEGRSTLVEALASQNLLGQKKEIAEVVAKNVQIVEYKNGQNIIVQNEQDRDVVFILTGRADVIVNGTTVGSRKKGEAVGEMSAIDPTELRSASIVARELTVVARLEHNVYEELLNKYVSLWRILSLRLAEKLRQRGSIVRRANDRPVLFIASPGESVSLVRKIRRNFERDEIVVRPWMDVFQPGDYTLEALRREVDKADFAIAVITPDDIVVSRKSRKYAPRDNVILEFGLFTGVLGVKRSFMLMPRKIKDEKKGVKDEMKLPSDVEGLTLLTYNAYDDIRSSIANACDQVRERIEELGVRT